jgi:lipid-binding SYLF domain-containing protein
MASNNRSLDLSSQYSIELIRSTSMKKLFLLIVVSALIGLPAAAQKDENNRIQNAGKVMAEILNIPDDIPADILDKAECVIVLPSVMKAAFIVGGSYGRGVMTCRSGREFSGPWSAPSMMALEGGSFGLQIGGEATDFVLLVMNKRGADSILTSQVKLGGDVAAAAGPKGRDAAASTDVTMRAEILSYSRSRGLFAGVSLEGSTLRPDNDGNERLYGKGINAKEIVINSKVRPPASAKSLISTLDRKSPRNRSGK